MHDVPSHAHLHCLEKKEKGLKKIIESARKIYIGVTVPGLTCAKEAWCLGIMSVCLARIEEKGLEASRSSGLRALWRKQGTTSKRE
jgi:hypothetical protein